MIFFLDSQYLSEVGSAYLGQGKTLVSDETLKILRSKLE